MCRTCAATIPCLLLLAVYCFGAPPEAEFGDSQKTGLAAVKELNSQVLKLQVEGKVREAISLAKQALEIQKRVLGVEHADTALALHELGSLLSGQQDFVHARSYYEEALKIRRRLDENYAVAESLHGLGSLLEKQGDFAGARRHYEESLAIYKELRMDDRIDAARLLQDLGFLLREQGDYVAGQRCFEQALKIKTQYLGMVSDIVTKRFLLASQGSTRMSMGDLAGARQCYEQALQMQKGSAGGDENTETADLLHDLGFVHWRQGDYAGGRKYCEQALKIRERVLGDDHPQTVHSRENLGLLLESQKEYAAARSCFDRVLQFRKKALGDEHPDTARSLNELGALLEAQADYAGARPYHEEALKIWRGVLGDEHPRTAFWLNTLSCLEMRRDNFPAAVRLSDISRRGARRHIARVLSVMSSREQLQFLQTDEASLHGALTIGWANRQDLATVTTAAEWLCNGKGMGQEATASQALLLRELTDPTRAGGIQDLVALRRRMASIAMIAPSPDEAAARRKELNRLEDEEARLSREFALADAQPRNAGEWVTLDAVREKLSKDAILIDVARFPILDFQAKAAETKWKPARYAAWVIPSTGAADVELIDLGDAGEIDAAVENVRTALANPQESESRVQDAFDSVSKLVWMPLHKKVGTARHLVLSPDSNLWLLPWGAIPTSKDRFLIEDVSIRYVIRSRDLLTSSITMKTTAPALFANPDFDLPAAQMLSVIKAVFPKIETPEDFALAGFAAEKGIPRVSPLPGTATELQAIAPNVEKLAAREPQVYQGMYALETVAKALHRPPILVMSTHGFFKPDQESKLDDRLIIAGVETRAVPLTVEGKPMENPLLQCGLLFAGCNGKQFAAGDDGILTGIEICGIDLRGTDLVVLSACETGIGKVRNGEGVAGLRQAFQLAGARSVVSTLWQIPDVDSARLMNDFFANMAAGQSKADALRNSQLKRIAARREKFGTAHPYYWAAYTLTGQ